MYIYTYNYDYYYIQPYAIYHITNACICTYVAMHMAGNDNYIKQYCTMFLWIQVGGHKIYKNIYKL